MAEIEAYPEIYGSLPSDCSICRQIMDGFLLPLADEFHVNLGAADSIFEKDCHAHSPIFLSLKERYDAGKKDQSQFINLSLGESKLAMSRISKGTGFEISMEVNRNGAGFVLNLELANIPSTPHHPGRGLILDPLWIDHGLFKKWKETCQNVHGQDCDNPLKTYQITTTTPTWLVDTQQERLVPGQPHMSYVALSYKWGAVDGLKSNEETLPKLLHPGSLSALRDLIPQTIKDAMGVVKLLGERYLWVDSLCISQDDGDTKLREINQMAAIYATACVTIVAGDGIDANHGLRGIQGVSTQRDLKQEVFPFGEVERLIQPEFTWAHISRTPYFDRGWTFQEYFFSKRRLIFENQMVWWECHSCKWHEDIVLSTGEDAQSGARMTAKLKGYPCLNSYASIVYEYNTRMLTYEEDCLPAFTGVTSLLSQKFEGGFLCGLPEMYFDTALTWTVWVENLTRRVSTGKSSIDAALECLPSWSWVGWAGYFNPGCYSKDNDFLKRGPYTTPLRTIPITEWYTSGSPLGTEKRRINSSFLYEREKYKELSDLPKGWTRHEWDVRNSPTEQKYISETNNYEHPPPEGLGSYYFTHESDPSTEFWYPIPIPDMDTPPIIPIQTPYLFCETHRIWLYAPVNETNERRPYENQVWLRDTEGTWAGVLLLHSHDDFAFFKNDLPQGPRVELVAISRGEIPSAIREHAPEEHHHDEFQALVAALYEFYNVLWIEWKDGIAYRRAYGRVLKETWERQNPEAVSLVMG